MGIRRDLPGHRRRPRQRPDLLGLVPRPWRPNEDKLDPYECGVPLLGESRDRFSVRFYLVAIMFILFDIETVFHDPVGCIVQAAR